MWQKDVRTEEEIYSSIAEDFIARFPDDPEADQICDEIFKAKFDSDNAVHCFFSPSKSNGWVPCTAYLDRAKQWDGSKEPAIRGTIAHHFLSKMINNIKAKLFDPIDLHTYYVFRSPQWLSEPGIDSAKELLCKCAALGFDNVESEVFLMSDNFGIPNKNLRFGGSIDVLSIIKDTEEHEKPWFRVWIYDLKTGKHVVNPNCWQLKCYALLVWEKIAKDNGFKEDDEFYVEFTLGISQNSTVREYWFGDPEEQQKAFVKIHDAFTRYKKYLKHNLNVGIDDERDSCFPDCFCPNDYCRFCRGCYKAQEV